MSHSNEVENIYLGVRTNLVLAKRRLKIPLFWALGCDPIRGHEQRGGCDESYLAESAAACRGSPMSMTAFHSSRKTAPRR